MKKSLRQRFCFLFFFPDTFFLTCSVLICYIVVPPRPRIWDIQQANEEKSWDGCRHDHILRLMNGFLTWCSFEESLKHSVKRLTWVDFSRSTLRASMACVKYLFTRFVGWWYTLEWRFLKGLLNFSVTFFCCNQSKYITILPWESTAKPACYENTWGRALNITKPPFLHRLKIGVFKCFNTLHFPWFQVIC